MGVLTCSGECFHFCRFYKGEAFLQAVSGCHCLNRSFVLSCTFVSSPSTPSRRFASSTLPPSAPFFLSSLLHPSPKLFFYPSSCSIPPLALSLVLSYPSPLLHLADPPARPTRALPRPPAPPRSGRPRPRRRLRHRRSRAGDLPLLRRKRHRHHHQRLPDPAGEHEDPQGRVGQQG